MNDIHECPACGVNGDDNYVTTYKDRIIFHHYDKVFVPNLRLDQCTACKTEGDFTGENTAKIATALQKSDHLFIARASKALADKGYTPVDIERVLGIRPFGTIRDLGWEHPLALAILRMVYTFPWLLEVGSRGFSRFKDTVRLEEVP